MLFVGLVVTIALIEYVFFTALTGKARGDAGIKAPATTGDVKFECYFRVQQNTLENLIIFLPAIYLFATYMHALTAAVIGLVFVIGRAVYFKGYTTDPAKRALGMIITMLSNVILLLGGLVGIILNMV